MKETVTEDQTSVAERTGKVDMYDFLRGKRSVSSKLRHQVDESVAAAPPTLNSAFAAKPDLPRRRAMLAIVDIQAHSRVSSVCV